MNSSLVSKVPEHDPMGLKYFSFGYCITPVDWAAKQGLIEVVKSLTERGEPATTDSMDLAAKKGHLDVVKYLYENRSEGCTSNAFDLAASKGHLYVLIYLYENTRKECTPLAMDLACKNGHLHIVKWIYECSGKYKVPISDRDRDNTSTCRSICTVNAWKWAACKGHLDILVYLHERRVPLGLENCGTDAMDLAAANDHYLVLDWLWRNTNDGCTLWGCLFAINANNIKTIEWYFVNILAPNGIINPLLPSQYFNYIFNHACVTGNIKMVKYLHRNIHYFVKASEITPISSLEACDFRAIDGAAENGHLQVVRWLLYNPCIHDNCHTYTSQALLLATQNGYSEVVKLLIRDSKVIKQK